MFACPFRVQSRGADQDCAGDAWLPHKSRRKLILLGMRTPNRNLIDSTISIGQALTEVTQCVIPKILLWAACC
jgi:hypothetical protein